MKTQFIVETCTFHGPTRQRRWHQVHTGPNRADCRAYIKNTVIRMYAHWDPERATDLFRVRGVRATA